jgi:hypothetical protein
VVICLSLLAAVDVAHAFSDPQYFGKSAIEGGTAGRWFTGAPTDGYDCGVCHTGGQAEKLVISGLPKNGYLPDYPYQITISWPQTAARTRALYDQQPPPPRLPSATLVAELVSETTLDSGSIEQAPLVQLEKTEVCKGSRKRFGYALYQQPHNGAATAVTSCSTENLTRCLIAVRGCGPEEVRIKWRAPKQSQGAIWFSASFVSTDAVTLTPEGDAVSTTTIPIAPAGTEYQSTLEQSCSLVAWPSATRGVSAAQVGPFAVLAGLLVWRSRKRQVRRNRKRLREERA